MNGQFGWQVGGGGGGGGGSDYKSIPYQTDIIFDAAIIAVAKHNQSADITLTVDLTGAKQSATTQYLIQGNGSNGLTIIGAIPINSTIAFDNTKLNTVIFLYDGELVWYNILNQTTGIPYLLTAKVKDADPDKLELLFSEAVSITTSGWSITTDGAALSISSIGGSLSDSPYFNLSRAIVAGEVITISYDPATGDTKDLENNELLAITNFSVTNTVGITEEDVVFQRDRNFSDYSATVDGNSITSNTEDYVVHESTKEISITKNFEVEFKKGSPTPYAFTCSLGIEKTTNLTMQHVITMLSSSYLLYTGKDRTTITTSSVYLNNSYLYRIEHNATTPSIIFKYSTDNGVNWINIAILTGTNYLFVTGNKARFRYWQSGGLIKDVKLIGDWEVPTMTISSMKVGYYPNKIGILCSESLDPLSVPAITDFTPSGGLTVSSIEIIDKVCVLNLSGSYISSDVITLSYTQGANILKSLAGSEIASFSSQAVTNEIANYLDAVLENTPGSNTAGTTISGNGVTFTSASVNDTVRSTKTVAKTSSFNVYFLPSGVAPVASGDEIFCALTVNTAINGAPLEFIFGKSYSFSTIFFFNGASRSIPSASKFMIKNGVILRLFNNSSDSTVYFYASDTYGFTWHLVRTLSNSTMDAVVSLNVFGDARVGGSDSITGIKLSPEFA